MKLVYIYINKTRKHKRHILLINAKFDKICTMSARKPEVFSTNRIEALSDGVFAIAMTLLVLNLNTPALPVNATNQDMWSALKSLDTQFVNFAISFLLLGSLWAIHMRQFKYINRADRHLTFINNLRLFVVVLIPFTTSLAGTYPDILLGRMLFPLNFLVLAIIIVWQWHYATKIPNEFSDNLSMHETKRGARRNKINLVIATCVFVLVYFIGTWAFLLFLFDPLILKVSVGDVKQIKHRNLK